MTIAVGQSDLLKSLGGSLSSVYLAITAQNRLQAALANAPAMPNEKNTMTRDELLDTVPVHHKDGRPYYVDLSEIPKPWREQFHTALYGSTMPVIQDVGLAAYVWDWEQWIASTL